MELVRLLGARSSVSSSPLPRTIALLFYTTVHDWEEPFRNESPLRRFAADCCFVVPAATMVVLGRLR